VKNRSLARDYILRSELRLEAVRALHRGGAWADVVRESQELVELALKALLRTLSIEVPRIHDVSPILEQEQVSLPEAVRKDLPRLAEISRSLRRDRELAFYGSEDLTPSEFYRKQDADEALAGAEWVVQRVKPHVR
jgi:HEPN domain-containing protein